MDRLKLLIIAGTRPQIIKATPLLSEIVKRNNYIPTLVDTRQHYDFNLNTVFYKMLPVKPEFTLEVSKENTILQISDMLKESFWLLRTKRFDFGIVIGDTNSTLAGAIYMAKSDIPFAHIEAGVRNCDVTQETINRMLVDHIASINCAPTIDCLAKLEQEGIKTGVNTGDLLLDAHNYYKKPISELRCAYSNFKILTVHRKENTEPEALKRILKDIETDGSSFLFPMHPRTAKIVEDYKIRMPKNIHRTPPVDYFRFQRYMMECDEIWTDSGGAFRESIFWGKPCIVLRDRHEWEHSIKKDDYGYGQAAGKIMDSIEAWRRSTVFERDEGVWREGIRC